MDLLINLMSGNEESEDLETQGISLTPEAICNELCVANRDTEERLSRQLEAIRDEIKSSVESQTTHMKGVERKLDSLIPGESAEMCAKFDSLTSDYTSVSAQFAESQNNYRREVQMHSATAAEVDALQTSLGAARTELAGTKDKLSSVSATALQLEAQLDANKAALETAQRETKDRIAEVPRSNNSLLDQVQASSSKFSAQEKKLLQHMGADPTDGYFSNLGGEAEYEECVRVILGPDVGLDEVEDEEAGSRCPRRVELKNLLVYEGHDDVYNRFLVESWFPDESAADKCRYLNAMKGLQQSPQLPCVSAPVGGGVVSIDLAAVTAFVQANFGFECETICPLAYDSGCPDVVLPFKFVNDDDDLNELLLRSLGLLSNFQQTNPGLNRLSATKAEPAAAATTAAVALKTAEQLMGDALRDPFLQSRERENVLQADCDKVIELVEDEADVLDPTRVGKGKREERESHRRRYHRPREILRDQNKGLTKKDFRRLLRRGGVAFESDLIFEELRGILKVFLQNLVSAAVVTCEHRRSKILTVGDVLESKPLGKTMLGFGGYKSIRNVWSVSLSKVLSDDFGGNKKIDPKAMSVVNDMITFQLVEVMQLAKDFSSIGLGGALEVLPGDTEEDTEDYDQRENCVKVYHIGEQTVKLYSWEKNSSDGGIPEGFEALAEPMWCVDSRAIQSSVRRFFKGELSSHAVSQATRAVRKFQENDYSTSSSLASRAGLTFRPEVVALIAGRLFPGVPLSEGAAVYLTAVLEYLNAEVFELASNNARDDKCSVISCRHLQLAVRNDEELNQLFGGRIIREGGVLPNIHSFLYSALYSYRKGEKVEEENNKHVSFLHSMVVKARKVAAAAKCPCAVFVDPRTGFHFAIDADKDKDKGGDDESQCTFVPMPVLDALSKETRAERMAFAQAALTNEERAAMRKEGYCYTKDDRFAQPPLHLLRSVRAQEICREQLLVDFAFPHAAFGRVVREIGNDFEFDLNYTAEAMECMQAYAESYIVDLTEDAHMLAIHAHRIALLPRDLQLARRIRCERS